MNMTAQVQAKPAPTPSFAPVRTNLLQRKCACGGTPGLDGECAECRSKRLTLQRRVPNQAELSTVPPVVHDVLRSPGQPLDPATRAFMEPHFGHDFSQVRVHTDARAAESARAVNALAYTVGRDVVFGVGQYAPGTSAGQRLLAHELTHAVQQDVQVAATGNASRVSTATDPQERRAEVVARSVTGESTTTHVASALSVQEGAYEQKAYGTAGVVIPRRQALKSPLLSSEVHVQRQPVGGERLTRSQIKPREEPRLVAPEAAKARRAECNKCGGQEYGSTECTLDPKTGLPTSNVTTEVFDTDPCTRPCVELHEHAHRMTMVPICKAVHECLNKARRDENEQNRCLDNYEHMLWARSVGMECAAYKVSENCLRKRESAPECGTQEGRSRRANRLALEKCYKGCFCKA